MTDRPKIALWFRYGPADHAELFHAMPRIVAALAARAEVHEMKMEGDVMRMRAMKALDLPAGQTVELKPGGYHLMFIKPKRALVEGERFTATLRFRDAGKVTATFTVRGMGAGAH